MFLIFNQFIKKLVILPVLYLVMVAKPFLTAIFSVSLEMFNSAPNTCVVTACTAILDSQNNEVIKNENIPDKGHIT